MIATTAGASIRVGLTGVGACVPDEVMTNEDIAERVETSDEWIVERTGIRQRHVADDDTRNRYLAILAAIGGLILALLAVLIVVLLTRNGDRYRFHASLGNGELSVNGEPFNILSLLR